VHQKITIYLVKKLQLLKMKCVTLMSDRNVLKSLQTITDIRAQQVENFTLILERYFGTYPKQATRIGITAAVSNLF